MGLIIIAIVGAIAVVFGVVGYLRSGRNICDREDNWGYLSIPGAIMVIVCAITMTIVYCSSITSIASLGNFHENNRYNLAVLAETTEGLFSEDGVGTEFVVGSLEKAQLANAVSQRYAELIKDINAYNRSVVIYERWDNSFLTNILKPPLPEHLKPIKIDMGN